MKSISLLAQAVKMTALIIPLCGLIACCPKTSENDKSNQTGGTDPTKEEGINVVVNTALEKYVKYVQGKGYCVEEYDKDGCKTCSLEEVNKTWVINCKNNFCVDEEKENQCTKYLSQEEILKIIDTAKQAQEEKTQTTGENIPQTEQRLVLSDKDAAVAAKNKFCGGITRVEEDQNGEGYWVSVRRSSDSIVKVFIKKSSVIPENNCPGWCDTLPNWIPWCN